MIDPRLVNVETPPPECGMGCQVRRDCLGSRSDVFEDAIRQVPQSQWAEMAAQMGNADKLVPYTLDQGREGSCVGNGSSWGFDFCQALQVGPSRIVRTSPMSLYKRIGQTASSGAVIGDALEELRTRGILPLDTPENRAAFAHVHPATGFARPLPAGWEETAASFRLEEYWEIATAAGMVSALLTGYAVVYGRSGHCICGVRPVLERGVWYVRYKNSWGADWGDHGYGYDTLSFLERQHTYGWYALRTVTYRG